MERIWACIIDNTIINTCVGDENFISLIENDFDSIIEITNLNTTPGINWTINDNEWIPPSPYPSWIWNGINWQAPIPMPETGGIWIWNEELQQWEEIPS